MSNFVVAVWLLPAVLTGSVVLAETDSSSPSEAETLVGYSRAGATEPAMQAGIDIERFLPLRTVAASDIDSLLAALEQAQPGDLIELADGDYEVPGKRLNMTRSGTSAAPVVIRARHHRQARIIGNGGFGVRDASHIAIVGLVFEHQDLAQALYVENGAHIRFSGNAVRLRERPLEEKADEHRLNWITLTGPDSQYIRIDGNLIENKRNSGVMLATTGSTEMGPDMRAVRYTRIDGNHFRNRLRGGGQSGGVSNFHTLHLGHSGVAHDSARDIIENNLFENCSGGVEIISVKVCDEIIRGNTFIDCLGYLSLRTTHGCLVEGNWFINRSGLPNIQRENWGGAMGAGGVWIIGDDHRVVNNYFEALAVGIRVNRNDTLRRPARHEVEKTEPWVSAFQQVVNPYIAYNTFINCELAMSLGAVANEKRAERYVYPPHGGMVNRNIFFRDGAGPLIVIGGELVDWRWDRNLFYPGQAEGALDANLPANAGRIADAASAAAVHDYWKTMRNVWSNAMPE